MSCSNDFLVDVEVTPRSMTTRIKQAISSVQLFIQRSLMSLQEKVSLTPKEAREWSQWRKQYRIWEANARSFSTRKTGSNRSCATISLRSSKTLKTSCCKVK